MTDFFRLIIAFWKALLNLLDSAVFEIGGVSVSILGFAIAIIVFFIVASVFWGGAKA